MLRAGGLEKVAKSTSRRQFLQASASAALLAGMAPAVIPSRAKAQQKTLRILQWKHFVPSYDAWFNDVYVKEWGEQNDTQVIVDNVGLGDIGARAAAEAEARQGHDLVMLLAAPALYEDQVLDHRSTRCASAGVGSWEPSASSANWERCVVVSSSLPGERRRA
jgi:hypothetical protein